MRYGTAIVLDEPYNQLWGMDQFVCKTCADQNQIIASSKSYRIASALLLRRNWHVWLLSALIISVLWPVHTMAREIALSSPNELKHLSIDELMDVEVVSVSRTPEKLSEAASSVQVITQEDIRRSGATSLPEALRLASNLQVAQKNSHDWGISARGFNTDLANKLLVMIDGRTVYTPLFSGVFWDVQDYLLADIDHIEVISGPGSTLWGANAVNGVINIITKHTESTHGLYVEAGGGSTLQDFAGVRYGGSLSPNVDFRVYGKHFNRGNEVLADGSDANDAWWMTQGGFRIDATASAQNKFTLQGDTYDGRSHVPIGGTAITKGANVLGRWAHTLSNESDLTLQAYYDNTHLEDPVAASTIGTLVLAPAGVLTDDLDTYDLDFQQRLRFAKRHQLIWGLGYRRTHDVVGNALALAFFPAHLDHNLYSGFIQDEVSLRDNLSVTIGSKVEHNDYTGFEIEPSGRLQWTINPQHMLWTAISRAVRTPSRIDRDLSQPASGLVILKGSNDFVSETVIAYEVGYRAQVSSKLVASVSTFYNDYEHVRSTSITPVTIVPFYFANNLHGETYGAELSGTYQVSDGWQLRFGYSPLSEHLRVAAGQSDLSNAQNETADPKQQASLRSSLDLSHHLEIDIGLRWTDALHINNGPNLGLVPSYTDMDMRVGWRPDNNIELSIAGQNLLHSHHPEYGFPTPARIEAARSVVAKLVWRL